MVELICSWIYLLLADRKPQRLIEYRRLLYTLSVFMFVYWFRLLVDDRAQLTGLVANIYQHDVLRERPSRYWPNCVFMVVFSPHDLSSDLIHNDLTADDALSMAYH